MTLVVVFFDREEQSQRAAGLASILNLNGVMTIASLVSHELVWALCVSKDYWQ